MRSRPLAPSRRFLLRRAATTVFAFPLAGSSALTLVQPRAGTLRIGCLKAAPLPAVKVAVQ